MFNMIDNHMELLREKCFARFLHLPIDYFSD